MLLLAAAAQQTFAATTWTVTKTADTNDNVCNADCSLREAVAAAQDNDQIKFQSNLAGTTITLAGTIIIGKSITINGNYKLAISGGDKVRIFGVGNHATVTMKNLDLGNAYIDEQPSPWIGIGGAIYINNASLELDNCYIHNSRAYSSGAGVGVIDGVLVVNNSLIAANKALYGGGGIYAHSSRIKISNTKFNLNTAPGVGSPGLGGALVMMGGTLDISDSSIYKSSSGSKGGAIYLYGFTDSIFTIRDSAIHNNSSQTGGGIYNREGKLNLINSTLSNNHATAGNGGALSNYSDAFLRNVTVTANTAAADAGGIDAVAGEVNFGNTIIAGNTSGGNFTPNITGALTSAGHNVIGPYLNAFILGDQTGNQFNVIDPMLNPLTYNGSATLNHLPKAGSPVIDAGSSALAVDESGNPLLTDQRGFIRIFGGAVDIGAVEVSN